MINKSHHSRPYRPTHWNISIDPRQWDTSMIHGSRSIASSMDDSGLQIREDPCISRNWSRSRGTPRGSAMCSDVRIGELVSAKSLIGSLYSVDSQGPYIPLNHG